MTTAVFDTLKATRHLENAGIETRHAEAIVQSMAEAFEDTVATKADIDKLAVSTKADIATVRKNLELMEARMLAAQSNAINRMLIAQLAVAGLLFAALKLF